MKKTDVYFIRKLVINLLKLNFFKIRLGNSVGKSTNDCAIPRVVFQTTRSKWIPVRFWLDIMKFRKRNPEFTFLTFCQKDMKKWMAENFKESIILNAFENSTLGVMQSDIFKYCYSYINGGISLDSTKYLSEKLSLVFANKEAHLILSNESHETDIESIVSLQNSLNLPNSLIINWCFATIPNHPAIQLVIEHIETNYLENRNIEFKDVKSGVWHMTATVAFNHGILNYFEGTKSKDYLILGIDFREPEWPKFQSSNLVDLFRRHYVELSNLVLFK